MTITQQIKIREELHDEISQLRYSIDYLYGIQDYLLNKFQLLEPELLNKYNPKVELTGAKDLLTKLLQTCENIAEEAQIKLDEAYGFNNWLETEDGQNEVLKYYKSTVGKKR
jgi:hypothetical protein